MNKPAFVDYYEKTRTSKRSYLRKDRTFRGEEELNRQLKSDPTLKTMFPGVSSFFDIEDPKAIKTLQNWVNKNKDRFGVLCAAGTPDISAVLGKYIIFLS